MKIKFYDVVSKKPVMVEKTQTKEMMSKNGRKMLVGMYEGRKLYKFI
jgi:hypothetical protein